MKAGYHVRHLHAGVVDVILHFDVVAAGAQHADESVAQYGIAQVSDVRGFIGIDIGMFDDGLPGSRGGGRIRHLQQRRAVEAAIEADVDVAVAGDLESGNAGDGSHGCDHVGGDLLRGLLERLRQLKSHR